MRSLIFLLYLFSGAFIGALLGFVLAYFVPICGEDCSNTKVGYFFFSEIFGIVAFILFWVFQARIQRKQTAQLVRGLVVVLVVSLLAIGGVYIWKKITTPPPVPQISG